jgi:spermidine/putrescine transport system substrate-binding protein
VVKRHGTTVGDGRDGRFGRPIPRRSVLKAAVAAPAAAILAACSRNVGPGPAASPRATGTALEDELNIYNWAAYLNPKTRKDFENTYDVSTTLDFYASNEDLIAKLKAGASGYDIVAPTGYAVEIMAKNGLLLELDHARLPNLSNVEPRFLDPGFDPGNRYSAPKDWGTTGIGYLSKYVDEDITSWEQFYDLGPKYSGKYVVLDSAPEVVGSALKMLGYSYNTLDQAEVDEATEHLIRLKPHIGAITSSEYRQMMSRGEAWLALGWNGDFFYVAPKQPSVRYVIPEEGSEFWLDNWSIPATAKHPNLAHEFINWILTPERQARESNYTYYASAVEGAQELTDEAIANDPAIYPAAEVTDKLESAIADPRFLQLRNEAWTKFKAA